MARRRTDPESYISEYTLVCEDESAFLPPESQTLKRQALAVVSERYIHQPSLDRWLGNERSSLQTNVFASFGKPRF